MVTNASRKLHLTSPLMKGSDVEFLQARLNYTFDHYEFKWREIHTDGEFGRQTLHAAHFAAWLVGLSNKHLKAIKEGSRLTILEQQLIFDPTKRSTLDRQRQAFRKGKRIKLRDAHNTGPNIVVTWASQQVGTTESPAGSNLGPGITDWEKFTGYSPPPGVFWCGCFACYAVVHVGGAKIPTPSRMGFGPYIIDDARNGNNGFHAVPVEEAQAGDVVVYWGGEHIGVIVGPSAGGQVHTIEGNTSATDGSQSNGGGVYEKHRPFSDVTIVARPTY